MQRLFIPFSISQISVSIFTAKRWEGLLVTGKIEWRQAALRVVTGFNPGASLF